MTPISNESKWVSYLLLSLGLILNLISMLFLFIYCFTTQSTVGLRLNSGLFSPGPNDPRIFQLFPDTSVLMSNIPIPSSLIDLKDQLWPNIDATCYQFGSGPNDLFSTSPTLILNFPSAAIGFATSIVPGLMSSAVPVRLVFASVSTIFAAVMIFFLIWRGMEKTFKKTNSDKALFMDYLNTVLIIGAVYAGLLTSSSAQGGMPLQHLLNYAAFAVGGPVSVLICKMILVYSINSSQSETGNRHMITRMTFVVNLLNITSKWTVGIMLAMKMYNYGYTLNSASFSEGLTASPTVSFQAFNWIFIVLLLFVEPLITAFSNFVLFRYFHGQIKGSSTMPMLDNSLVFVLTLLKMKYKSYASMNWNYAILQVTIVLLNVVAFFIMNFLAWYFTNIPADVTCSFPTPIF